MTWRNKKVLVAGGTGLIGIPLVEMLIDLGANVKIVSLDDPERANPQTRFQSLDLTVLDNARKACDGMDYVFNLLGAKASPISAAQRPASHYYPNVMMSMAMLEAARLEKVGGFMYTSSIAVYAQAPMFDEDSVWDTQPSPQDWFGGWAKRAGELQIEAYRKEYSLKNLNIVRPANVYGPWDNFDSENSMVVPSLIKKAFSARKELIVWGDGSPVRDFIHARDVARGMLLVAEKNPGLPVNLGSGHGYSIKDLAETVVKNLPQPIEIAWDTTKPKGDDKRIMNMQRAAELGFKAEISLSEGIRDTMVWYQTNKDRTNRRYDIFNQ